MAIAYGSATTQTGTNAGATLTAPVLSGSDRALVLIMVINGVGELEPDLTCTYNGADIAAYKVGTVRRDYARTSMWVIQNPASAADWVLDWAPGNDPAYLIMVAAYYTGVNQTTPARTAVTASGPSNPATVDVTNSQQNDLIVGGFGVNDVADADGFTSARCGAGQTYQGRLVHGDVQVGFCDEPGASGTVVHSWDYVDNTNAGWACIAVPLIPIGGPPRNPVPMGFVVE